MAVPNYYTSKYGTKVNVTGLSGKPLAKIQGLADSRYGTKAQALADKQRLMIPKVSPPLTTAPGVQTPATTTPAATNPAQKFTQVAAANGAALTPDQIKYNNLLVKIKNKKATTADMHERNRLYNLVGNPALGAAAPAAATPVADAAPTGVTPVDNSPIANAAPGTPSSPSPGTVETLFPSTRMFEPQNYEGSPLYKFQVQQGQKQLSKSLAARGLSNSGHAIEEELNIPLRAAAQDTDRITRIASENADRLKSFQDNEALRQERAGNTQWDRSFNLAELMANQSPWVGALAGLNNTANLTQDAGNAEANYLKEAYKRIIAASGGGGGGGSGGGGSSAQPLTVPTGPNYSNITPQQIVANNSSNNGWTNILTTALAGLLK